jgi:hypothetical protein
MYPAPAYEPSAILLQSVENLKIEGIEKTAQCIKTRDETLAFHTYLGRKVMRDLMHAVKQAMKYRASGKVRM